MQQLTLYLGQPTWAFATVIAGMLVFAGLGSLTDRDFQPQGDHWLDAIVLPAVLVATALLLPAIMSTLLGTSFATRCAILAAFES